MVASFVAVPPLEKIANELSETEAETTAMTEGTHESATETDWVTEFQTEPDDTSGPNE